MRGQHYVKNDWLRFFTSGDFESPDAIGRGDDPVVLFSQVIFEDVEQGLVIFHDEYFTAGYSYPLLQYKANSVVQQLSGVAGVRCH